MPNAATIPADTLLEQAIARHKAGQLAAAEDAYRMILAMEPGHAGANHNLGVILVQTGRVGDGLAHLERAVKSDDRTEQYFLSYARGLLAAGRPDDALAVLAHDAGLLDKWGSALLASGRPEAAIGAYRRALTADPDCAEAHYHLGSLLSESGRVAEGFAHFMRRAALVYGTGKRPATDEPDPPHKREHDLAQRNFLWNGNPPADAPQVPDMFRLADGARVQGPAVNPANATTRLAQDWRCANPQMVVMDDFLTPEALKKLRAYCAGSTVWRKNYPAGYLGAAPEDGFACPLLAQIVEEIQTAFAPILGEEKFRYLGAFKYDSELCTGTNTHADNSGVNVNFYIAPDDANLDAQSGGMEIWDVGPPDLGAMRRLNASEGAVREFLQRAGAKRTVIPHRANRAVIFKSTLFHKTDNFKFKTDYLSRRINVSLLFGQFG
ncbi:MAG TPA: tetratricopeptide repeat protein [Rhizomicrobium sp.]|jgi:tetratricopeptide (TPR) repeat protein|nr:tetratricopeptide repeat protein [Rhizomicrobium sp.]